MNLQIRQATIEDLKTLQEINNETFVDNQQYDIDLVMDWAIGEGGNRYFTKALNNQDSIIFIAERDGKPVGYVSCAKQSRSYRKSSYLEMENMGVIPGHRSNGIGSKLIETVKKWAKENGYHRLYVNAYFHNSRAVAFYKRNGFSEIDISLETML